MPDPALDLYFRSESHLFGFPTHSHPCLSPDPDCLLLQGAPARVRQESTFKAVESLEKRSVRERLEEYFGAGSMRKYEIRYRDWRGD
jgi:hypothetical protein